MLRRAVIVLAIVAVPAMTEPAVIIGACHGGEHGHLRPVHAARGTIKVYLADDEDTPICMLKPFMHVEVLKDKDT